MKVTEPGLNKLIDNLNTLICEDSLLTRQERETLVLAVAAIGAMKARVGLKKGDAPTVARREKREKKDRQPDPRFPRAGHPWQEDEKTLLSDALDSVPDEEIGRHLFWLSEKLGRTPFSVAFQIAAIRELQDGWEEQFRAGISWRCVDTLAWPQHGSKQTINGLKRSFPRGMRDNDAGKIPTSVAAAAPGADCAGRP